MLFLSTSNMSVNYKEYIVFQKFYKRKKKKIYLEANVIRNKYYLYPFEDIYTKKIQKLMFLFLFLF